MLATIATTRTVIAVSRGHLARHTRARAPRESLSVSIDSFCVLRLSCLARAQFLSISVSLKLVLRLRGDTESRTLGDSLGRTAMHSISNRQKATHEHAQHVEEEPVQPADYRAVRVIEIERATIRSWPLPRRRLIARRLARSVV